MIESIDPSTNEVIARVRQGSIDDYQRIVDSSLKAAKTWSLVPAPKRGEILRQIADELRSNRQALGQLVRRNRFLFSLLATYHLSIE